MNNWMKQGNLGSIYFALQMEERLMTLNTYESETKQENEKLLRVSIFNIVRWLM